MVAVRCPSDFGHLLQRASGLWEPDRVAGIERRRIGPVILAHRRDTDPLFRRAGISLDEAAG
jgi:hypothetical protein